MAITPDQRAVLQLLLERGQSYSDLATLLAVDESEVRSRARAALTELGGADPDRNVGLTDYLLGQADPIGRADAVRHLQSDPGDHQLATDLAAILREAFPSAELPRLPGEPRQPRRARRATEGEAAAGSRLPSVSLSQRQTRLIAILGAAALILIAAVLGITGAFGGDGDDDGTAATTATTTTPGTDEGQQLERVRLRPRGGGDAGGEAIFGLATADQAYVDISISGLDQAPQGQTYVVWLLLNEDQGYPLSPIAVSDQGTFEDRFSIPSAVLPVVARVRFVDVSIAPVKEIRTLVRDAIENTELVLQKPGETVLQGEVPRAAAASGAQGDSSPGSGS
jgi:Anti-sigma-K factor rskA